MKVLATLVATVFLSAVVTFLVAGLPAYARAETERAALSQRADATRRAQAELAPVSYADTEALAEERDRLSELGGQRLSMLTDPRYAPPASSLRSALERSPFASLAEGAPLRTGLEAWAVRTPRVGAALARTVELLSAAGIDELESLDPRDAGASSPLANVPDLEAIEFELVVVSEMPDVLELLESLVPGRGEPVLSVLGASLRRIDPGLWSTVSPRLATPPVRLWVRVQALAPATPRNGGS